MNLPSAPTRIAVSVQSPGEGDTRLYDRLLVLARVVLLAISILAVVVYIVGILANLDWFNSLHADCLDVCMTTARVQALYAQSISITAFAIYWTSVNL
jgi:hypothetical protein